MVARFRRLLPSWSAASLGAAAGAGSSQPASAHIKWFCAFDVGGQPRVLDRVLVPDFDQLAGLALCVLLLGCVLEGTPLGAALIRAFDRVTGSLRDNTELLFRVVCGFFFVALWTTGGILLTPELKTASPAISWLQLAIAAGMMSRRTLPFSALGIVFLFGLAVKDYGVFHLMDYPIFLGIAAYLALTGLRRDFFGMRPLDIVRWAAAITLMWASIEKWAYPEWTFPLFIAHPAMTMGFDGEFYMRAAGVIEFTLAFALVWTPLVRRVAATILAGMFLSAVLEFGKIDAIGHAPIVVVMLAIMGDRVALSPSRLRYALAPVSYVAALAGFLVVYYGAHAILFGTSVI